MQLAPIFAPFMTVECMPIRVPSPIVQPCRMTLWPTVQLAPMTRGKPGSVCSVQLSCTLLRSPTSIHSLSPRSTAPNQTLAPALSLTLPMSVALSAT